MFLTFSFSNVFVFLYCGSFITGEEEFRGKIFYTCLIPCLIIFEIAGLLPLENLPHPGQLTWPLLSALWWSYRLVVFSISLAVNLVYFMVLIYLLHIWCSLLLLLTFDRVVLVLLDCLLRIYMFLT